MRALDLELSRAVRRFRICKWPIWPDDDTTTTVVIGSASIASVTTHDKIQFIFIKFVYLTTKEVSLSTCS